MFSLFRNKKTRAKKIVIETKYAEIYLDPSTNILYEIFQLQTELGTPEEFQKFQLDKIAYVESKPTKLILSDIRDVNTFVDIERMEVLFKMHAASLEKSGLEKLAIVWDPENRKTVHFPEVYKDGKTTYRIKYFEKVNAAEQWLLE